MSKLATQMTPPLDKDREKSILEAFSEKSGLITKDIELAISKPEIVHSTVVSSPDTPVPSINDLPRTVRFNLLENPITKDKKQEK